MAPRKDASEPIGIDALDLPKALVTRLAKSALPPEAKLQKDTLTALMRGATVFINYISATAQDVAAAQSRRTIGGTDVLMALEVIALGELVPLLRRELEVYREEKGKGRGKGKGKEGEVVREQDSDGDEEGEGEDEENVGDEPVHEPELEAEQDDVPGARVDEEEERAEDEESSDSEIADVAEDEEEVEDAVALEEEELRRDARGVEESGEPAEGE